MPTSADIQNDNDNNFLQFVESLDPTNLSSMLSSRILPSFLNAMRRHNIEEFSQNALTFWTVEMMVNAMKSTTVQRYLGALHTVYKQWSGSEHDANIDFSLPNVRDYNDSAIAALKLTESNLQKVAHLTKINKNPLSKEHTYLNSLLYLLINPEATLSDVVELRFSDPQIDSFHIDDIKLSMRKAPQAQYVFPLEQGKRRKPAIIHDLLLGIKAASHPAGLEFGNSFSRDSITAIWIAAAIREEISYGEIRAIIKQLPTQYSFLSLIPEAQISGDRKTEILNSVASSFINYSTGWYVMRLRSGVTPDTIKDELKYRKYPLLRQIEFYAPQRKVKKLIKKKAVAVDVPVLPGILFFRMRYDKISKMMSLIGDLAWCYRTTNSPTSPYSAIPQREMKTFQRSVGSMTADIEMDIIASQPPLNVGDEVIIENGTPLDGQQAVIRKVKTKNGNVSYTLRLSDSEFIHWNEVTVSAASLTKVKDNVSAE